MDEPLPIDPERLLAQTAWVRRLARSLARDEASADDLVQETFVAALRRPPAGAEHEGRLRAWFGFVLRNMAIRRRRADLRRADRELRSLERGPSDSDERAEELEHLRAELFRHVKALAEPARQAVLLHYFEELDSAEIARRLGVPDSSVRNRLRRALAELRERLQRDHGADWRNLCLFVLPNTGAKVAVASGALVAAASGLWIAGGAVAAVALGLVLWIEMPGAGERTEREALAEIPVEIPRAAEDLDSRSAGARSLNASAGSGLTRTAEAGALRVLVSDSYEPTPTTSYAHGIIVHGLVRDENGELLDDVAIGWTDPWGRMRSARVDEGKYSANSFVPGVHIVRLSGRGCGPVLREVTIAAEPELQQFDFTERRARVVPVYVLDRDGANLVREDRGLLRECDCGAVMTHKQLGARVDTWNSEDGPRPDWSGLLQMHERGWTPEHDELGPLQFGCEPPYFVSLLRSSEVLATQRFDEIPERVTFRVERSTYAESPIRKAMLSAQMEALVRRSTSGEPPPSVALRVQFLDGNARPVMARFRLEPTFGSERANGRWVVGGPVTWSWTAHADGTRVVENLPPGTYVLSVTGTADDDVRAPSQVGALPRRVEVSSTGDNHLLVAMRPARDVLLRSRCAADEVFDWEIRTQDDFSFAQGKLVGHAPRSVRVPAGEFVVRLRAAAGQPILAEERFSMGEQPLVIELTR